MLTGASNDCALEIIIRKNDLDTMHHVTYSWNFLASLNRHISSMQEYIVKLNNVLKTMYRCLSKSGKVIYILEVSILKGH